MNQIIAPIYTFYFILLFFFFCHLTKCETMLTSVRIAKEALILLFFSSCFRHIFLDFLSTHFLFLFSLAKTPVAKQWKVQSWAIVTKLCSCNRFLNCYINWSAGELVVFFISFRFMPFIKYLIKFLDAILVINDITHNSLLSQNSNKMRKTNSNHFKMRETFVIFCSLSSNIFLYISEWIDDIE